MADPDYRLIVHYREYSQPFSYHWSVRQGSYTYRSGSAVTAWGAKRQAKRALRKYLRGRRDCVVWSKGVYLEPSKRVRFRLGD